MKIVDLEYEDIMHEIKQNVPRQIARMKYHQKYLLLELGNEVYELEITDVTDTAFYLKIKEDYPVMNQKKEEGYD